MRESHWEECVWEGAARRHLLDALTDIYLITPDNRKHGSAFVSGNKVLAFAGAYFGFIALQIRLHLHRHLHVLIQAGKNTHV